MKKDKSEKDLKALCADQLDVFLQKGTRGASHKASLLIRLNATRRVGPPLSLVKKVVQKVSPLAEISILFELL